MSSPLVNLKHCPLYIELSDEPHPFYTCGDLVRGVVRVDPSLRPQSINITFKGNFVMFDQSRNGVEPTFFQYSQELFAAARAHAFDILRQGTARDGKVELPFKFRFPHTVSSAPPAEGTWLYPNDSHDHPRFQHSPGFLLPPSCPTSPSGNAALSPRITYILEACMDTATQYTSRLQVYQELKFIPPAPEYDLTLLQPNPSLGTELPKHLCRYKFIKTRKLFPNYEKSNKLGKIRDKLVEHELFFGLNSYTEVPFVKFNLLATPARILVIGSQVPIIVSVQHLERSKSLPNPPDVFMRRVRVQLLPTFVFFFPSSTQGKDLEKDIVEVPRDVITLLDKKFEDGNGEPLLDSLNLADIGDITPSLDKVLPSFTSYGVCLEYKLQVDIWGECASREFAGMNCREQVTVVSRWNANSAADGSALPLEADSRPVYQELDPMAALHELDSWERFEMDDGVPAYDSAPLPGVPTAASTASRPMPPPYLG
jgi:hypothetical protein